MPPRHHNGPLVRTLALSVGLLSGVGAAPASPPGTEPILPVPPRERLDVRQVTLGEKLFHDARLSRDNSISCASCHPLARGGADRLPRSPGVGGAVGTVNTPTVFNTALNFVQFWDGRAATLAQQVDGPVHNPVEMASSWQQVLDKLREDRELVATFREAYPDGLTEATIRDALSTFERSLTTVDAPFDRFLRGEADALPEQAQRGYRWFRAYGCTACHQGAAVGGNMYQQMGVMGDYFADRGGFTKADLGRFNVTGDIADRHVFKVPSLRLAALTPPYFHDGSAATLDQAISVMARYQLGREIPPAQREDIAAFLRSLVGTHPLLNPDAR